MEASIMWIIIAVIAAIIEGCTPQLVSIWFAVSALVTAIVAVFIPEYALVQLGIFVAVSIICLIITRPLVRKFKKSTGEVATNSDRYIGKIAEVIVDINNIEAVGQVKVDGSVWTARSSTGESLPAGTKVVVNKIEGVKMIVTPVNVPQTTMA